MSCIVLYWKSWLQCKCRRITLKLNPGTCPACRTVIKMFPFVYLLVISHTCNFRTHIHISLFALSTLAIFKLLLLLISNTCTIFSLASFGDPLYPGTPAWVGQVGRPPHLPRRWWGEVGQENALLVARGSAYHTIVHGSMPNSICWCFEFGSWTSLPAIIGLYNACRCSY